MIDQRVKRILLVTWNYPPKVGGIEQLLYQLVQQIKSVISTSVLAPHIREKESEGAASVFRASRGGLFWFSWHVWFHGNQLLKSADYDLIMGGSALVSPLVYLLSKRHRLPRTVYVHGLDLIYENLFYQTVMRILLPKMDRLFANSKQTKAIAIDMGVPENRVSVLHPGLHTAEYDLAEKRTEIRQRYQLNDKKVLLYTGRLVKRKGVYEFVKYSLAEIVRQHEDVLFCIIGGNPETSLFHKENIRQLIEEEVKAQDLEDFVRFFGWVERQVLLEMYAACDIFLLPAIEVPGDMEGFGIVLAEANAAGKSVVSTRVGGIPDAVVDEKSAILVEPESWGNFSAAVMHLLEDRPLREDMGKFGAQRVKQELDWSFISGEFLRIINFL